MSGKTIIHGGGQIDGRAHTNSIEAVLNSLAAGERQVEIDCVKLADGFAIAHDEVEKEFYGIEKKFVAVTQAEFQQLHVFSKYNPATFDFISKILTIAPETKVIIDAKFPDFQFVTFLQFLQRHYGEILNRLYYQIYSPSWVKICHEFGIRRTVVALWKYFDADPLSDKAYEFASCATSELEVLGVTVRWWSPGITSENVHRDGINRLAKLADVYFHGQSIPLCREKELLHTGINFFSSYSLGSLPERFDAQTYKKKYNDLSAMSDLCAACHFLEFGAQEGRSAV